MLPELWEVEAGRLPYSVAYGWQRDLHARRIGNEIPDVLLMLEHEHVYTLGRRFLPEHLLLAPDQLVERGIQVYESDRGGSITYHGPGQLVAYPVVDLRDPARRHPDVIRYLRTLEQAIVGAVSPLGVEATTREGLTGVWVGDHKLAAIGVNVSRGVAKHGVAINVSTDLDYFRWMVPCGIADGGVTSLEEILGTQVSLGDVAALFAHSLARVLGRRPVRSDLSSLGLVDAPSTASVSIDQMRPLPAGRLING
ncbi:MAG TPA: lipoyl(octanoyl) transferase LipB [Actinomycetota bacterium]|nr:lipoyl(octanoyl) transferase LipB [Actinomycetota bacterium]